MLKTRGLIFLIYFVIGLYLLNSAFEFITLPGFTEEIGKWITAIAGVLVILGGITFWKRHRH